MSNVVHVDFRSPRQVQQDYMISQFRDMLARKGFCEDDILDILDGIRDYESYQALDSVCRHVVDVWHHETAKL
jgi:hypothetical protein